MPVVEGNFKRRVSLVRRVSGRAPERFPACRDHPRSLMISVKEHRNALTAPLLLSLSSHVFSLSFEFFVLRTISNIMVVLFLLYLFRSRHNAQISTATIPSEWFLRSPFRILGFLNLSRAYIYLMLKTHSSFLSIFMRPKSFSASAMLEIDHSNRYET